MSGWIRGVRAEDKARVGDIEERVAELVGHLHLGRPGIAGVDAEAPDGITFTDQWGRPLPTVVAAIPPAEHGRPPPDAATYRHPDGGRLLARDVVFQSADREERRLGIRSESSSISTPG